MHFIFSFLLIDLTLRSLHIVIKLFLTTLILPWIITCKSNTGSALLEILLRCSFSFELSLVALKYCIFSVYVFLNISIDKRSPTRRHAISRWLLVKVKLVFTFFFYYIIDYFELRILSLKKIFPTRLFSILSSAKDGFFILEKILLWLYRSTPLDYIHLSIWPLMI